MENNSGNVSFTKNNQEILRALYEQYPESLNGLYLDGDYLVYNNERVNISGFNIEDLLNNNNNFINSLVVLSSEDVFKIIRLHALMIESKKAKELNDNKNTAEIIKSENPLMKNITTFNKETPSGKVEYISIIDSNNVTHLFRNDYKLDLFSVYEDLKAKMDSATITPEDLISAMEKRFNVVELTTASDMIYKDQMSEDYHNKLNVVNNPHKGDLGRRVYGSEADGLAVLQSELDNETKVVDFTSNKYGDLVTETHGNNVNGIDTITTNNDESTTTTETSSSEETEIDVKEEKEEKTEELLIPEEEFYRLINTPNELTKEETQSVNLWFAFIGDLVLYKDYLLPELQDALTRYEYYVVQLESMDESVSLNNKQIEAINKYREFTDPQRTKQLETDDEGLKKDNENNIKKTNEKVKTLVLTKKPMYDVDRAGSVSIMQVISLIAGIAIILTAVTLYLLG